YKDKNPDIYDITFLVLCVFVFIAGLINLFIVAVDFLDWLRGRKIKACEKIQFVLALSRICYLCFSLMQVLMPVSDNWFIRLYIVPSISVSINYTGLWYLTLMSVLFFLKIADCKHVLFIRLKVVMTRRLMCFIVGVTLISVANAGLRVWVWQSYFNDTQPRTLTNATCMPQFSMSFLFGATVGNSGPFILYSVSFIMLVTSLPQHVIRMRSSDTGLSTTNLDSYNVAIKSLVVCFLIFSLQVGSNVLGTTFMSCFGMSGLLIYANVSPALHSVYLIYRKPKLRQRFSETIQAAANYLTMRGDQGTGNQL
uniref:Taste receptor type 2 n=1 Tax=Leptobrachium leishanense TaxID=445787 RepID=A0A8C5MK33_9ANUR